jgi:hypothetical protein
VDGLREVMTIGGMFLLRLGVPLVITFAVAYFLRRLDAKWQAETLVEWEANQSPEAVVTKVNLSKVGDQPCWSLKGCDETVRANCAAPKQPSIPCWLARRRSEGKLPAECYNCAQFSLRQIA